MEVKYKVFINNNKSLAVHECEIIKDGKAVNVLRGILSWSFTSGLKTEPFNCEHAVRYDMNLYDTPEEAINYAKQVIVKLIEDRVLELENEAKHCNNLMDQLL